MYRGERWMSCCHLLEKYVSFLTSDFTYNNVIRSLPQTFSKERKHVNRSGLTCFRNCLSRNCWNPVRVRQTQFGRVFYAYDFFVRSDEKRDDVKKTGFTRCRTT